MCYMLTCAMMRLCHRLFQHPFRLLLPPHRTCERYAQCRLIVDVALYCGSDVQIQKCIEQLWTLNVFLSFTRVFTWSIQLCQCRPRHVFLSVHGSVIFLRILLRFSYGTEIFLPQELKFMNATNGQHIFASNGTDQLLSLCISRWVTIAASRLSASMCEYFFWLDADIV